MVKASSFVGVVLTFIIGIAWCWWMESQVPVNNDTPQVQETVKVRVISELSDKHGVVDIRRPVKYERTED